MAHNMTTQLSRIVPEGDRARSGLTGVARHLLSVSVIALLFGLSPAAAQFRIDRAGEVTEESSGVIQSTVGYLADTTTGGGDNLGDHIATQGLNMAGFGISGILTPDGSDPGAGVNVQYVEDMFGAYTPPEPDLSDYVTKSGMPQTITSAKTFDGPVLFSDDVQVTKVPASTRDVTNKAYVDDAIDDLVTLTTNQSVSGDKSFTGSVAVRTPTGDMGAANKLYVDNAISAAGGSYVTMGTDQIIGGTPITGAKGFSGAVTFGGEVNVTSTPDDANDAVNKDYVDGLTDGLAGRLTAVEGDVVTLQSDVTTLQGDVTTLRSNVTTLQGDVSTLDSRITTLANTPITAGSGITASGTLGGGVTIGVDTTVVRTAGAQTIAGVKNFSALPTIPVAAPVSANQVASKAYVDAQVAGAAGTTYTAGDGMSLTSNVFAVDGSVVRTTGAQTIAGAKTFSGTMDVAGTLNANGTTNLSASTYLNTMGLTSTAVVNKNYVDTTAVNRSTAQTIGGVKTFSASPVVPVTPTLAGHAASKSYVDAQVASAPGTTYTAGSGLTLTGTQFAADGTVVRTTGDQTLAGIKTFSSPIAGSITGNAATATALATPRTINGVAFDGSAAISLPTVNTTGAQAVAGVKTFSDIPVIPTTAPALAGQVASKGFVDGLDAANVKLTGAQTIAGVKTFSSTVAASISGNAATATKLTTPRNINGVAFDGSAAITLPTVNTTGNQTVDGVKAFSSFPTVPTATDPTTDNQVVSKKYADSLAFDITRHVVYNAPEVKLLVPAVGAKKSPIVDGRFMTIDPPPAGARRFIGYTINHNNGLK